MGNIVDVQVTDEKVVLKIPPKDIVHEVDNVATFDSKSKKLLYVGVSQKVYRELYPKKWEKRKNQMEFLPIFDVDSFSPEAAAMLLWDWWNEMTRQGVAGHNVFRNQAKLELNIFFENYELIPKEKAEEFEYLILKFLYVKRLAVNGKEKHWGRRNWLPSSLYLGMTYIFIVSFLILSAIPMAISITLLDSIDFSPMVGLLLYSSIFLGSIFVFVYLGNFIASLLWILLLKPFFERKILITTLSYPSSQPRKRKIGKIEKMLVNWMLPENN